MIIRVTLENWMSFRDKVTLSMIASRELQHGSRVPKLGKYRTRLLPIAAMYGGNASGKTNFCAGLAFAKWLIVKGTQPDSRIIPVEPFKLDDRMAYEPSKFCFELLIDETVYEFSFSVNRKAVLEEKLVKINSSSEKVLYYRRDGKPNFGQSLNEVQFLEFAFRGTRENQLFLTNSVFQNINEFRPVYDWFRSRLKLIAPRSLYAPFHRFFERDNPLHKALNKRLPQLDTGIVRLDGIEIPFENIPMMNEELRSGLEEIVSEDMTVPLPPDPTNQRFAVTRKDGELVGIRLVTYHHAADGQEARMEMSQESSGSQRLIDLLPAFFDLEGGGSKSVYVIDELDRSLHTVLTRRLVEAYLAKCSKDTRTQLLLTTHDVLLMDQKLLRRDEMWVAERDDTGASSLLSFSDYKNVRKDKDVRKSYLQGRLGGIPRILFLPEASE